MRAILHWLVGVMCFVAGHDFFIITYDPPKPMIFAGRDVLVASDKICKRCKHLSFSTFAGGGWVDYAALRYTARRRSRSRR